MDTKEKPKGPSSLTEYEAIPRGGWKLAGGILAVLTILTMTGVVSYAGILLDGRDARVSQIICAFIAVGGLVVAVYFSAHVATLNWFKYYWHRNVRGYVVAHYTEGGRARCSDPFPRGQERLNVFLNAYPFVVLWPLGGWFHRPRAYWRARQSWWSVARDTRFPGTPVRVTDKNGSPLRFAGIADAMSFIAVRLERAATESFWHDSSDMPFSWLRVLEGLSEDRDDARKDVALVERKREELERRMTTLHYLIAAAYHYSPDIPARPVADVVEDNLRHLIAERDAARAGEDRAQNDFEGVAEQLRAAVGRVKETVAAFDQSSRLRETIEGLRVFHRMVTWLLELEHGLLSTEERAQYTASAEWACVKIAEKERRDRRRHGGRK